MSEKPYIKDHLEGNSNLTRMPDFDYFEYEAWKVNQTSEIIWILRAEPYIPPEETRLQ